MRTTSRQQSIGSYQEVKSLSQIDPFQQPSPDYIPLRIRGVFGAAAVVVVGGVLADILFCQQEWQKSSEPFMPILFKSADRGEGLTLESWEEMLESWERKT